MWLADSVRRQNILAELLAWILAVAVVASVWTVGYLAFQAG